MDLLGLLGILLSLMATSSSRLVAVSGVSVVNKLTDVLALTLWN